MKPIVIKANMVSQMYYNIWNARSGAKKSFIHHWTQTQETQNFVKQKVTESALGYLLKENIQKEKTRHILFEELKVSEYLLENRNRSLSIIIFSVRSQTLDIKEWKPWKYVVNLCVMCNIYAETMDHFVCCTAYGEETELN